MGDEPLKLYWGDLHAHCGISYGAGTLEGALSAAAEHLDFCSITGHAKWPDMPRDRRQYGEIIDYHTAGFERLARGWTEAVRTMGERDRRGRLVVFPSWEWHSLAYGDHNVYFPADAAPLFDAETPAEIKERTGSHDALVIPHHIGYPKGLRGINWDAYTEDRSPFVEIYSLHGCSESDEAPYPYLHDMGPRESGSLAREGLRRGLRFGFVGSTDTHTGYPGHHGGGRVGAWATGLSRQELWDAFKARRVYAVTGDRIAVDFSVDGAAMGSVVRAAPGGRRVIALHVRASDAVSHVEIIRSGAVIAHLPGRPAAAVPTAGRLKFRVEWGWGDKRRATLWDARLAIRGGRILGVEKCFRAGASISPGALGAAATDDPLHRVVEQGVEECAWLSTTVGNPSLQEPSTCSLVFEVEAEAGAEVTIETNGLRRTFALARLLEGSRAWPLRGWLSESVCVHRAVPRECYEIDTVLEDPGCGDSWYYCRVAQHNGQWAWGSPVWVEMR